MMYQNDTSSFSLYNHLVLIFHRVRFLFFSIFPYSHASCWYNVCRWLMFVKVEILQVLHAYSVEHIVEVSQTFDMYALALCHAHIHAGRNASQHGLNVRVTYCGDARHVLGNRLRFHRFLLHDGAGVVNFFVLLYDFL